MSDLAILKAPHKTIPVIHVASKLQKTAIILGISSDIGLGIAERLTKDGWRVIGVGRTKVWDVDFYWSNLSSGTINTVASTLRNEGIRWDLFISAVGTTEPIGKFFDLDFNEWERSVIINATAQLRFLHAIWGLKSDKADIMFFAGGGTNGPFRNYSAYCVSKIALIKMCELLHDENPDDNFFIIGPGYVKTKIHQETIRAAEKAGDNFKSTMAKLEGPGTPIEDIYNHLKWCMKQGCSVIGGRNTATLHDPWWIADGDLPDRLRNDKDAYRLRRKM